MTHREKSEQPGRLTALHKIDVLRTSDAISITPFIDDLENIQ